MACSGAVAGDLDLTSWLREQCADYGFGAGGVFLRDSDRATWPLIARDPAELEARLSDGGHLLPLPKEPAALANVLEVSILNFLESRISQVPGAVFRRGTERGYPDLEISGAVFGRGHHAIDVKAARRARNRTQTQSRITLYTGNTYFRWPDLHWPGTFRPFNEYVSHLDLILIYTLNETINARVEDLEVIVQEPWRIASRERSSTTREYIGAVTGIPALRAGQGAFETPAAFYDYWRRFPFKVSPQVQNQLKRLLASAQQELAVLRRQQPRSGDE